MILLLILIISVKLDKIKGRAGHISFIRDGKFNIYGGYNDDGLLLDFAQVDYSKYINIPRPIPLLTDNNLIFIFLQILLKRSLFHIRKCF